MTRTRAFVLPLLALCLPASAENAELFILWGIDGRWDGELQIEGGAFMRVEPYSFEPQYGDQFLGADRETARFRSGVGGQVDGLRLFARVTISTRLRLQTTRARVSIRLDDVPRDVEAVRPVGRGEDFVAVGYGDPAIGPRRPPRLSQPTRYRPPPLPEAVDLRDDWWQSGRPIRVALERLPTGPLRIRRFSRGDGRLYLYLDCADSRLTGRATIEPALVRGRTVRVHGGLCLRLRPRIGKVRLSVTTSRGAPVAELTAPTTLVEARGRWLYVNGEPFLVKGTLARDLDADGAAYLRSLGANTLRGRNAVADAERFGFMAIAAVHVGPGKLCERSKSPDDETFFANEEKYLAAVQQRAPAAACSPQTLIIQVGNEQASGSEAWAGRVGKTRPFERLDHLLARLYNLVKPLDPMLPVGYSNNALGYMAPSFLDVYLHNTYLSTDRGWPPLEEFMRRQGCDRRPFIHTEFGANVYMPQACLRGPNSPVLEKIHAWNYPNRWRRYLAAGTCGGTNYCFYDYDYSRVNEGSWDKGFTNFGVMTFDRKPKLACWELWHLWRDFETEPAEDGVRIRYCRDYWARRVRLTVCTGDRVTIRRLDDFPPHGERVVKELSAQPPMRWTIDYETHRGLMMQATGGWPEQVEREMFFERLRRRPTFPFLRQLFDAQVVTPDGRPAPATLKEMERSDGVVVICFRKPSGTVYVTAFTRRKPDSGFYRDGVEIQTAFRGPVVQVDELSGAPLPSPVETRATDEGLRLLDLRIPYMPQAYSRRAREPIRLTVIRIG